MFGGFYQDNTGRVRKVPDCECVTCGRELHHLGIMRHRAMHRDRKEDCIIIFSDGRKESYSFSKKEP